MTALSDVWSDVDYIRGVYEGSDLADVGGAQGLWIQALAAAGVREEMVTPRRWELAGYSGWQVAGVGVATSETGAAVVQVPGAAAGTFVRSAGPPSSVSRLDLQVTGLPPEPAEDWISGELARMLDRAEHWAERGRAPRVWYVVSDATTVYSGRRASRSRMLRVYNSGVKHASRGVFYTGTVRYELETARAAAQRLYHELRREDWDENKIAGRVAYVARQRGCAMVVDGVSPQAVEAAREGRRTTEESTLRWLKRQVAPSVERLLKAGVPVADVLAALGMESAARPAGT